MLTPSEQSCEAAPGGKKPRGPARKANPTQRLLTVRQASEHYGIPQRTLYSMISNAVLAAVQFPVKPQEIGRRVWLRRDDIERLISNSVTSSEAFTGPR